MKEGARIANTLLVTTGDNLDRPNILTIDAVMHIKNYIKIYEFMINLCAVYESVPFHFHARDTGPFLSKNLGRSKMLIWL